MSDINVYGPGMLLDVRIPEGASPGTKLALKYGEGLHKSGGGTHQSELQQKQSEEAPDPTEDAGDRAAYFEFTVPETALPGDTVRVMVNPYTQDVATGGKEDAPSPSATSSAYLSTRMAAYTAVS